MIFLLLVQAMDKRTGGKTKCKYYVACGSTDNCKRCNENKKGLSHEVQRHRKRIRESSRIKTVSTVESIVSCNRI